MNYIKLSNPRLFSKLFMYIDTYPNYGADSILDELGIKYKILSEYDNKLYPKYHTIIISVNKKHINKFEFAMNKLKDKMLILGNKDYEEICNSIIKIVINGGKNNGKPKEL